MLKHYTEFKENAHAFIRVKNANFKVLTLKPVIVSYKLISFQDVQNIIYCSDVYCLHVFKKYFSEIKQLLSQYQCL